MSATKLDPRLRFLQEQEHGEHAEAAVGMRLAAVKVTRRVVNVEVLLRCRKIRGTKTVKAVNDKLTDLGVAIRTLVDGPEIIAAGTVALDQMEEVLAEDWIEEMEASHRLFADLDLSGADVGVRPLQTVPPTVRGANVLVGIVDGGIAFHHDDFRLPDGTSRIRFLWDQAAAQAPGGPVPFGREYTKADLDAALRTQPPPVPVAHNDPLGHGTHVAGIAAGNGRTSNGRFMGMAPDTELVIVALRGDGASLGESSSAVAACRYIVDRAHDLGRPVAINLSQGMNAGGHSGETTLEVAMDNLARLPGIVLVKSAGNEQTWRIHAAGSVPQGATVRRQFDSSGMNLQQDVLEVWFDAADQIALAVQAPGAPVPQANDFVTPGNTNTFQTPANNRVRIDASSTDASGTGDVRAVIFLSRGAAARIQPGRWTIHCRGDQISHGDFHVWIERTGRDQGGAEQSRFTQPDNEPGCTISIPGTARRILTVGSYVTRPESGSPPAGELSRFSSHGPSRYGLRKPEIAAPGEWIASALSSASGDNPFQPGYTLMAGTSMAAPHVTGAAALLLEIDPQFTCDQVKQLLMRSARRDGAAAVAPDDSWGDGKLDVQRAVALARSVQFPAISNVTVNGTVISWQTDITSTGAVRFNTHRRRLALGRASGSRTSLTPGQQHSVDLQGLPAGAYHGEILAFSTSAEEWRTVDDNQGNHFALSVP